MDDESTTDPATLELIRYVTELGADGAEIEEALRTGTLGPLALELAVRPQGERIPFSEAAAQAGLELQQAVALWRALGFPDPLRSSVSMTSTQIQTLRTLAGMSGMLLGPDKTLQIARVIGASIALVAEAIVDAFRVEVEMPRQRAGQPYPEIVRDYARSSSVMLPALADAVNDVLQSHIVAVARASWTPDWEEAAVTRDRTVGFVDLVGYTHGSRELSPAALAATISRFETHVSEVVSKFGGRVVKLIGDEAMFVIDDPGAAVELALELSRTLSEDQRLPAVRIGMAAGPCVSHHGDYYGDVVNLAARLVKAAEPAQVLVSASLAESPSAQASFERVRTVALKDYEDGVPVYRLTAGQR